MVVIGRWRLAGLAIGLLALVSPQAALAGSKLIWAKAGSPGATMEAQFADCAKEAKLDRYHSEPNPVLNGPLGIMISDWFETRLYTPGVQANALARCMFRSGYRSIRLTAEEQAELESRRTGEGLLDWVNRFYASPDFARRFADASPPALPDASPDRNDPGSKRTEP